MVPSDWLAAGDIGHLTFAKVEHRRDINGLYFQAQRERTFTAVRPFFDDKGN
jgi:hypothetical protein